MAKINKMADNDPISQAPTSALRGDSANRPAEPRVRVDQTRQAFAQLLPALAAEAFPAALSVLLLWSLLPHGLLQTWAVGMSLLLGLGVYLHVAYCRAQADGTTRINGPLVLRWLYASIGLAWGLLVVLAAPRTPVESQLLLVALAALAAAGGSSARAPLPRVNAGYLLLVLAPAAIALLARNELLLNAAGLALPGFGAALLLSARRSREHMARLSTLGNENAELLVNLANARDKAEATQRLVERANGKLQEQIRERERIQKQIESSKKQTSAILANVRDVIFQVDLEGRFTWVSPSIEQLLGLPTDEVIGASIQELCFGATSSDTLFTQLERQFGVVDHYVAQMKRSSGARVWVSINAHYTHASGGGIFGIEGTIRDITEYRESQEALYQEKGRAQVTLRSIGDGVITTDVHGVVEYLNPAAEKFTGWELAEARGSPVESVLTLIDESTRAELSHTPFERCLQEQDSVGLSEPALLVHRRGENEFSIEVTAAPIKDSDGYIIGTVLVFHDVTKLRSLARQMSYQALHDPLTGLINRREFESQLSEMIESVKADFKRHSVCFLDLDQFKVVNDTCGHIAGDELLKAIATVLRSTLREADTLARLGGDEFGVLLKGCPLDRACEIAESMRSAVESFRFNWAGRQFRVGVSVGVVPVAEGDWELTEVLSAADSAMYVAKEGGRNRVHVFEPDDTAVAQRHGEMQWMQTIQWALERDLFKLYYQPIISLADPRSNEFGGEVLLRLVDADGELVMPRVFMPAAERYHLMPAIDRWVVKQVFIRMSASMSAGMDPHPCAINLSGQSLSDAGFLDFILDQLHANDVPTHKICFEITETAVVANIESAQYLITELRGIGCRFALDDFGSGMSSFAYLKSLPVDYLKIDGSFVVNLTADSRDRSVVKAINEIGHVMGIKTVAEFVENDRTQHILRMLGVDFAQGYGISRPVPLDDYIRDHRLIATM